jgi:beta-N-acetylhexosaminidase
MMAHVLFPEVDTVPASFSQRWIGGLLRAEFGFDGAVVCDDLSMAGAAVIGDAVARAEAALAAGCDLLPVCNDRAAVYAILDSLPAVCDVPLHRVVALHGR